LSATLGLETGREAAAEALAYGWEHWERIREMENSIGYLYVVGRDRGRKMRRNRQVVFPDVIEDRIPWVEPGLPRALAALPERERVVVLLVHAYGWAMSEVAELLEVTKSTVQTHSERGVKKLRRKLGVSL
jgi:DNA-directed RNA polymerase specialized sigma24 family protein